MITGTQLDYLKTQGTRAHPTTISTINVLINHPTSTTNVFKSSSAITYFYHSPSFFVLLQQLLRYNVEFMSGYRTIGISKRKRKTRSISMINQKFSSNWRKLLRNINWNYFKTENWNEMEITNSKLNQRETVIIFKLKHHC